MRISRETFDHPPRAAVHRSILAVTAHDHEVKPMLEGVRGDLVSRIASDDVDLGQPYVLGSRSRSMRRKVFGQLLA